MLSRYPHNAVLYIVNEVPDENGLNTSDINTIEIKGRYEPQASLSKDIDYRAKFYCNPIPHTPFSLDGQTLKFNGKDFVIVTAHNYQTHCEIWLE